MATSHLVRPKAKIPVGRERMRSYARLYFGASAMPPSLSLIMEIVCEV